MTKNFANALALALFVVGCLLAWRGGQLLPVYPMESARLQERTVAQDRSEDSAVQLTRGLGAWLAYDVIAGDPGPRAHRKVRAFAWAGVALAGMLMFVLWHRWNWPLWLAGLTWCLAALAPHGTPLLVTTGWGPWCIVIVCLSALIRMRWKNKAGAIFSGAAWSLLLIWAPEFVVLAMLGVTWIAYLHYEDRWDVYGPVALVLLLGIIAMTVLGDRSLLGMDGTLDVASGLASLLAFLSQVPVFTAICVVSLLDFSAGRGEPAKPAHGGWLVLGGVASAFLVDWDVLSSLCIVLGCMASGLWWIRMSFIMQGLPMRIAVAILAACMFAPNLTALKQAAAEGRGQRDLFAVLEKRMSESTVMMDETYTVYFFPNELPARHEFLEDPEGWRSLSLEKWNYAPAALWLQNSDVEGEASLQGGAKEELAPNVFWRSEAGEGQ